MPILNIIKLELFLARATSAVGAGFAEDDTEFSGEDAVALPSDIG